MPNISIIGPKNVSLGAVSYRKTFARSRGKRISKFLVTFKLGGKLRQDYKEIKTTKGTQSAGIVDSVPTNDAVDPGMSSQQMMEPSAPSNSNMSTKSATPPVPSSDNGSIHNTDDIKKTILDGDSNSDLEILDVRNVARIGDSLYNSSSDATFEGDGTDTESELSSLNNELDLALRSEEVDFESPDSIAYTSPQTDNQPSQIKDEYQRRRLLPSILQMTKQVNTPPPPGYRNLPPNLVFAIRRELNLSVYSSDDIEAADRMTFSLKDPILRTKIQLPIKSIACKHFECFDFSAFCTFYNLPPGVMGSLKRFLLIQSKEAREAEAIFLRQQKMVAAGELPIKAPGMIYPQLSDNGQVFFTSLHNKTAPFYKCPLCDAEFGLKQLYISDIFNFFVKSSPRHVTRVELAENDTYRMVSDHHDGQKKQEQLIEISDDTENDSDSDSHYKMPTVKNNAPKNVNDFKGALQELILKPQGDGSWGDPVILE